MRNGRPEGAVKGMGACFESQGPGHVSNNCCGSNYPCGGDLDKRVPLNPFGGIILIISLITKANVVQNRALEQF